MLTCIVGINWGDEGKGRMVDLLSREADMVCRCQGGDRAERAIVVGSDLPEGNTAVSSGNKQLCDDSCVETKDRKKYILNQLPSGILNPDVICIMGNGMCICLDRLKEEMETLEAAGVALSPANLKISHRAVLAPMPECSFAYPAARMGDLLNLPHLETRLRAAFPAGRSKEEDLNALLAYYRTYAELYTPYICDTGRYLEEANRQGRRILLETRRGALRDVDFGVPAFAALSHSVAAYAPIDAGIPGLRLDRTVGVMKAYATCDGEGPFVSELPDAQARILRDTGCESDLTGGSLRRIGAFDAVASRYGVRIQGADELALTKLDALSFMDKIPICAAYDIDGIRTTDFPCDNRLLRARPVMEYADGWNCDISMCRQPSDLPVQALTYIKYLEELVGARITYASVGPERDASIRL